LKLHATFSLGMTRHKSIT